MMKSFFSSLRFRLILLVLLALLPALGMIVFFTLQNYGQAKQEAQQRALVIAQAASHAADNIVMDAKNLLFTLSQIPQVQQRDQVAIEVIFTNLLKASDRFLTFNAVGLDGVPFAGAPPIASPVTYADRDWFQRAMETKSFEVSGYLIGRRDGKPLLAFSHPVFNQGGKFSSMVVACLDLGWISQFLTKIDIPKKSTITVVDHHGVILARRPELPELVGKNRAESPVVQAILTRKQGVIEGVGLDGVERFYGFTSLGQKGRVYVSVGLSKEEVLRDVYFELKMSLAALGVMAFLALGTAWIIGGVFVLNPVKSLLEVTQRLEEGDLTVRAGPPYPQGEIGVLARGFDDMAASLERQTAELKETMAELDRERRSLEQRVQERTMEFQEVNDQLTQEIARRQQKEGELARSNADLEQFACAASHDLQEPLRIIANYLQLLERRDKGKLDDEAKRFIDHAVAGAARMQRLINDLLQYSRVDTRGKPFGPVSLDAVFQDALANLKVAVEVSGAVVTADPLPRVKGDAGQLALLLQNLLGNALKFRREEKPRVYLSCQQADGEWVLALQDNGIGIEPEYLDRIFGVFQRLHTRAKYPGTGIGLAICKKIVERHRGRIWVESEPNAGSTFYFTIPQGEAKPS